MLVLMLFFFRQWLVLKKKNQEKNRPKAPLQPVKRFCMDCNIKTTAALWPRCYECSIEWTRNQPPQKLPYGQDNGPVGGIPSESERRRRAEMASYGMTESERKKVYESRGLEWD